MQHKKYDVISPSTNACMHAFINFLITSSVPISGDTGYQDEQNLCLHRAHIPVVDRLGDRLNTLKVFIK